MIKIIALLLLSLTACSTPTKHNIDLAKLKPEERAYAGNIQVDLNGMKNDQLTCDLFLNSDINPMIRLSADGDYLFKSIKKTLAFSKIACIYKIKDEKHWINHSLELSRVKQPTEDKSKEIYNLGNMVIVWKVDDSEFKKDPTNVFGSEDKMRDIGKLEVKNVSSDTQPIL